MNELIKVETMTSVQIAEVTGKRHSHVMRDIRNMIENINKSNESTLGSVGSVTLIANFTKAKCVRDVLSMEKNFG